MIIVERERGNWTEKNGYVIGTPAKYNIDGEEILKWMRGLTKIKELGIKEMPKCIKSESSTAIGRFMDTNALKFGYMVAVYVVRETGLYRQWVYIDSPKFTNDGCASTLTAISEASIMKSILKYKDGKRVGRDGEKALEGFYERYIQAWVNGYGVKTDKLANWFRNEFGVKFEKGYTLEDVKEAFETQVAPEIDDDLTQDNDDYSGRVINRKFNIC